jgi:hypothetical protein
MRFIQKHLNFVYEVNYTLDFATDDDFFSYLNEIVKVKINYLNS